MLSKFQELNSSNSVNITFTKLVYRYKREKFTLLRGTLPLALACWRGYPKDIACRGLAFTQRLRAVNRPDRVLIEK